MSLSGSLSGRVGALGAAAAAWLARTGRALPVPAAGPAGADLEARLVATSRSLSMTQTAALVERITMEADLRNALVAGDLVLRYHPIVDLRTGHTIACEALCRWRHWAKGLLGPAQFLPLAEESGLIVTIGGWVLEESARRLAQWRARLAEAGTVDVTVNLSAIELRDPGLVDRAAQALDASGLPAERLVVEVTEAAAYAPPHEPAARNLSNLADLGVGLAIDDVGAGPRCGHGAHGGHGGHGGFDTWLWDRPIVLGKISRRVTASLGSTVDEDGDGAASVLRAGRLLTAALGEGRDRNIPIVAKGIETTEQLTRLVQLGCPAGQGFLFARPMDAADTEAYLRRTLRASRRGLRGPSGLSGEAPACLPSDRRPGSPSVRL